MPRLTRESIVDVALQLLDAHGLAGVSTRKVANALGVRSPALYWHFKNVRELLDAVASAMLSSAPDWPGPSTPGVPPQAWLASRAHALRRALLAHRDGAAVHAGTMPGVTAPGELEDRLRALVAHGLSPLDAVRTTLAITRSTVGWVLEEQARASRDERAAPAIDPDLAPTLAQALSEMRRGDPAADFDFGLRAMISGVFQSGVRSLGEDPH